MNIIINNRDAILNLAGKKNIAIYCMGGYGKTFLDMCLRCNISITNFIDNNIVGEYKGIEAVKPDLFFRRYEERTVVICNKTHYREIYDDLIKSEIIESSIFVFMPIEPVVGISYIMLRNSIPLPLIRFETHLVNHCILNCKGCDHFCPLADEWFADTALFKKDMHRMSEIFDGEAQHIRLIGGEPLLHPDIVDFMEITRGYFRDTIIDILTNGLLLPKMSNKFWECCKDLNIGLNLTQYPVDFNYQAMEDKAKSYGIRWKLKCEGVAIKTLFKTPLNLEGTCDPLDSYLRCTYSNVNPVNCSTTLEQGGNLYTCCVAAHAGVFNKYFKLNISRSKKDYINIHSDVTADEVIKFLARPIPMCRYCDNSKKVSGLKWEQSRKTIDEWIDTEQ